MQADYLSRHNGTLIAPDLTGHLFMKRANVGHDGCTEYSRNADVGRLLFGLYHLVGYFKGGCSRLIICHSEQPRMVDNAKNIRKGHRDRNKQDASAGEGPGGTTV